ncbi:tetratricopeptide (TPR) repeat protein [Sinorhizobium fredii]
MFRTVLARIVSVFPKRKRAAGKKPKRPNTKPDYDSYLKVAMLASVASNAHPKSVGAVADLYVALGLPFKSIEYLERIPVESRPADIWLRLALVSSKAGDMERCEQSIDNIDVSRLTAGQAIKFHLLQCQLLADRGDFDGILSYLGGFQRALPFELEQQRLEAIASLGHIAEVSEGYRSLGAKRGIKLGVVKAAINHFHRINDHRTALAMTMEAQGRWPKDLSLQATLCRTYWSMGNSTDFVEAVKKALCFRSMVSGPVMNHALKARKLDPSVDDFINAAIERVELATKNRTEFWSLDYAHTVLLAGRRDLAESIAVRYIQGGGIAPLARYVLALCKLADGEFRAALAELKSVLQVAPYLDAAYHQLYTAAAASEDIVNEIVDLIQSRRCNVARFRQVDSHGRMLHQNPDLIALHYINDEFERGLQEKVNRRALNSLTYLSPKNRPPVLDLDFSRGGESIFLIADDGVSDEVRWAQHLNRFAPRFERVEATCEPRLLGLMQRSFPGIKFHAVNRIWGESPKRFADLREDVPSWELAHYLDGKALLALKEFEKVAFTNEMVLATVKECGTLIPDPTPGGYLLPDPDLKRSWGKEISRIAGDRKRIGVLWRSSVVDRKRGRFYFQLESLRPLMEMEDCELFSLQHAAKPEEIEWCRENGINILDIDLFEDFEGIAAISSEMDVVVGPSTLPMEMAAAVGTPTIIPGVNFETVGIRLHKGAGAACRHTKNSFVACDPQGYSDPEADQIDRLNRVMLLIADEIRTARYGAGLSGY